jgi:hypothetical protein
MFALTLVSEKIDEHALRPPERPNVQLHVVTTARLIYSLASVAAPGFRIVARCGTQKSEPKSEQC